MSYAVLFPGQGSQFVGMGADLFEEHPEILGEEAEEILGWSLEDLCLNGPEEKLTRTEHAQPALFALSVALWQALEEEVPTPPAGGAGHSLGEYSALVSSGALSFADGLTMVAGRGRSMADAADLESSGMAAILGADIDTASTVVAARRAAGGRLQIANINAPGQIVLAGGADDIQWLMEKGKEFGVRRSIPLKVAGAFHSAFMEPAAQALSRSIQDVSFKQGSFPIWSNVSATPHDLDEIPRALVEQVTSPVRFSESLVDMYDAGISTFVHVGPGDVTAGLARRTVEGAEVITVSSLSDIPPAVDALGTMGRS